MKMSNGHMLSQKQSFQLVHVDHGQKKAENRLGGNGRRVTWDWL